MYDFTKLNQDQYFAFKSAFVTKRMFNDVYKVEENPYAMDTILSVLCMIMCNKVPKGVVPFKTDSLATRVRLVMPPRGLEVQDRMIVDENGVEQKIAKNTNERAVVRILVPKRKMTPSEIDNEGRTSTVDGERRTTSANPDEKKDTEEVKEKADEGVK